MTNVYFREMIDRDPRPGDAWSREWFQAEENGARALELENMARYTRRIVLTWSSNTKLHASMPEPGQTRIMIPFAFRSIMRLFEFWDLESLRCQDMRLRAIEKLEIALNEVPSVSLPGPTPGNFYRVLRFIEDVIDRNNGNDSMIEVLN